MIPRRKPVRRVFVLLSLLLPLGAAAQEEASSLPVEGRDASRNQATEIQPVPVITRDILVFADQAQVGINFAGSQYGVDSTFIPPDTMGAVGPDHVVELINGRFDVYDKATGTEVATATLDGFWTARVGLSIPANVCSAGTCTLAGNACASNADCSGNFTFDPRIVYDPASSRWIAAALDRDYGNGNNIYIARSDGTDPTEDWDGFQFDAETVGAAEFHDYETLAVDADGVYLCTQDFNGGGNESCYAIPKADVLAAVPTAANMTRFEATPAGLVAVDGSWQPALDFGASDGRAALLGTTGGQLRRTDILGGGGPGATLGTVVTIGGDPGHAAPPAARQPHPNNRTIENVGPRFVSNVFEEGNSLWAVHAVAGGSSNSAIRWYRIDETTNTVLQTGLIETADEDYHEPSVAANAFGDVVIGYTCSGPNLAPSSCVSVGTTSGNVTTFEGRAILQTGAGHYWRDFNNPPQAERNRWGDYSATVRDPEDQCTFWTFQEYVAVSATGDVGPSPLSEGGSWGVQITELRFTEEDCNRAPACAAGGPYVEECEGATTTVALDASASVDREGDTFTFQWTTDCPGGTFDDATSATPVLSLSTLDTCVVQCSAFLELTDQHGATSSCAATVQVVDTLPPSVSCPAPASVQCTGNLGTPAGDPQLAGFFAGASASDVCDPTPSLSHDAPAFFPLGTTDVDFTGTDSCTNAASCGTSVTVVDTIPPTIEVTLDRTVLWPANHKLVPIHATVVVEDTCDPNPTFVLTSATSDEPDEGLGDGDFPGDIQGADLGTPDTDVLLRSERSALGDGRTYTLTYTAQDAAGNTTPTSVQVEVPHDRAGGAKGSTGFSSLGTSLVSSSPTLRLLLPPAVGFDPRTVAPGSVQLGNTDGVALPIGTRLGDVNCDGVVEYVADFRTSEVTAIQARSGGTLPIGLRYETTDGVGWLVPDIFQLGSPVPSKNCGR